MSEAPDFPFDEVVAHVEEIVASDPEAKCFQKFTCAGCGARLTIDAPNRFHVEGTCDNCPAVTNIKEQGCNFIIMASPETVLRWIR